MNCIDDFDYSETTYDYSEKEDVETVNKWLDDFGWV